MPTQLVTKAGSHVSTVKLCEQQSGPVLPGQMCHTFTDCELLSHKVGWLSEENVIWLYSAIHIGSHWKIQDRRQIKNTDNTQTKHNTEKQTMQNTAKQNYPGLVAIYITQTGNETGLFYDAPSKHGR